MQSSRPVQWPTDAPKLRHKQKVRLGRVNRSGGIVGLPGSANDSAHSYHYKDANIQRSANPPVRIRPLTRAAICSAARMYVVWPIQSRLRYRVALKHSDLWPRDQPVDATLERSLSAGVLKPKVSLGRWFKRSAILSNCA
jgi:hypothetical protein